MPISPARLLAHRILLDVEHGAYASDALLARSAELDSRDAGLAHEIVFGVLRRQLQLDAAIDKFTRKLALDTEVRVAARMGVYQLWFLDRVPKHAVLNDAVELTKLRVPKAAGLVNALLRRLPTEPPHWNLPELHYSCPPWLLEKWKVQFGRKAASAIATAFLSKPETYLRIPPGAPLPEAELAATPIEGCWHLVSGDAGPYRRQDISSQAVVPHLELQPGHSFLDLCAAPGNKTAQAVETAGLTVRVACELHHARARMLTAIPGVEIVELDATKSLPFARPFDRILLDAPCSGTGTLGRNPEIKWRVQQANLLALAEVQRALLRSALSILKPGGRVVYSTCSLEREENEEVVASVVPEFPSVAIMSQDYRLPGREAGDGFFTAVLTSQASH